MPDIFGLDLAGIINDAIQEAGDLRPGVYTNSTPGSRGTNISAGRQPTTTTHTCSCYAETSASRRDGSGVSRPMAVVGILGASLSPAVEPKIGGTLEVDGDTWTLVALQERDPASALFVFEAEKSGT